MIHLLILDFDGTLHPYGAPATSASPGQPAQLCYLPALEAVLREFPHVQIVIASGWRNYHSLEELRAFFSADLRARIIGMTSPDLSDQHFEPGKRQRQVEVYLEQQRLSHLGWVALDDEWDNYLPDAKLVKCDDGFTAIEARALREHLVAEKETRKIALPG